MRGELTLGNGLSLRVFAEPAEPKLDTSPPASLIEQTDAAMGLDGFLVGLVAERDLPVETVPPMTDGERRAFLFDTVGHARWALHVGGTDTLRHAVVLIADEERLDAEARRATAHLFGERRPAAMPPPAREPAPETPTTIAGTLMFVGIACAFVLVAFWVLSRCRPA